MRQDGPSRRAATHGAWKPLSREAREQALLDLDKDVYAASARGPQASRLKTIRASLASWGAEPVPPSMFALKALAASLKAGGYASASAYLVTYKVDCERQGHLWTAVLNRAYKDFCRSCDRGRCGPTRARLLQFEALGELPFGREPWVEAGPINPGAAIPAGSW